MKLLIAAVLSLLLLAGEAEAKTARCDIRAATGPAYRGACHYAAGARGSFTVRPLRAARLTGETTSLSVTIVGPGLAEVRGLTARGINSRWGEARRSRRDRACWTGADFRICVY